MMKTLPQKPRTRKAPIVFERFSKKQLQILTWWRDDSPVKDSKGIIMQGAIRTGKTLIGSMSFVMWAMHTFDGKDFAFCGKTIGSLRRNVVNTLKKVMKNRGYYIIDNRSENKLTIRYNGHENTFYLFGGKDESSQDLIQGGTWAGVFFDEVALQVYSFVVQATARCSVKGSKWWFNCNPRSPFHWFKTDYVDEKDKKRLLNVHFVMEDNPSLDEQQIQEYKAQYKGAFYLRNIEGKWALAEGLIYDMFGEHHIVDSNKQRKFDEYHVAIDYGTQNATTFLLFGKEAHDLPIINGKWHLIKEYYYSGRNTGTQKTEVQYEQDLAEFLKDIPYRSIIVDAAAASFITYLRSRGYRNVRLAQKDVNTGIKAVANKLSKNELFVYNTCTETIKEFYTYSWKQNCAPGKEEPDKAAGSDHCMDALRYFVFTYLKMNQSVEFLR